MIAVKTQPNERVEEIRQATILVACVSLFFVVLGAYLVSFHFDASSKNDVLTSLAFCGLGSLTGVLVACTTLRRPEGIIALLFTLGATLGSIFFALPAIMLWMLRLQM